MNTTYLIDSTGSITLQEHELKLIGEIFVAAHDAQQWDKQAKEKEAEDSPLAKHSACLKKSYALDCRAKICRRLSALYESTANKNGARELIDELAFLIK